MPDDALLSDLCSICNTNKSKYKCPGCSARTCSLPCYKRHQQWAQCSGQRDPTKFVKKSLLSTPAGVDHDFNFLTGIERDIEKAGKVLEGSDGGAFAKKQSWSQEIPKGQINYQHLEASNVKVIRAPTGLSRQKENKSHRSSTKKSTGGKNIMWTVEWIDHQKRRQLTQTSSTCPIIDAQPFGVQEQHKLKKRKRHVKPASSTSSTNFHDGPPTRNYQGEPVQSVQLDTINRIVSHERERSSSGGRSPPHYEDKDEEVEPHLEETCPTNHGDNGPNTEPVGNGQHRFFLVKPRARSSRHVLIPLNATATLGECLIGCTVLEFPTIYVFPHPVKQLPDEFILEGDYLKQEGEEQQEFDQLMSELDPQILRRLKEDGQQQGNEVPKEEHVDDKEILDVLKKDFGAVF